MDISVDTAGGAATEPSGVDLAGRGDWFGADPGGSPIFSLLTLVYWPT